MNSPATISDLPALPERPRLPAAVFWAGWVNVLVAAAAMVATLPGRTVGLGLVTEPLLRDLGVGRVGFGVMNLWATVLGAAFALAFGPLVDRFGGRPVLALNALLLGATVLWMAGARSAAVLAVALTLTRGLGQSALSAVSLALVGKWFVRRVNVAMGVYAALVAVGFIAAVPGVQYAVEAAGWRAAWAGVGWAVVAVGVVAWLFTRSTPESVGLVPDGNAATQRGHDAQPSNERDAPAAAGDEDVPAFTLRQALATPAFWAFAAACAAFNLVFSAVALFSEAILRERGLYTPGTFRAAMGVLAAGGIAGNAAGAWLAGRVALGKLLSLGMLAVTASLLVLAAAGSQAAVLAYAALLGVAGGVVTVVFFSCWPKLFGRPSLGRIQGAAQVLTVLASALGPVLLALGERQQGSLARTLLAAAPVFALLALACWFVPRPTMASRGRAL